GPDASAAPVPPRTFFHFKRGRRRHEPVHAGTAVHVDSVSPGHSPPLRVDSGPRAAAAVPPVEPDRAARRPPHRAGGSANADAGGSAPRGSGSRAAHSTWRYVG